MNTKTNSKNSLFMNWFLLAGAILLSVLMLWVILALTVWSFRHPWATKTEGLMYLPEAMKLERTSYEKMRPREVR